MLDDLIPDIRINPSPRPAPAQRQRSRVRSQIAAVAGHARRRVKQAPAMPRYAPGVDPNLADQISAQRPYTGPRHF